MGPRRSRGARTCSKVAVIDIYSEPGLSEGSRLRFEGRLAGCSGVEV